MLQKESEHSQVQDARSISKFGFTFGSKNPKLTVRTKKEDAVVLYFEDGKAHMIKAKKATFAFRRHKKLQKVEDLLVFRKMYFMKLKGVKMLTIDDPFYKYATRVLESQESKVNMEQKFVILNRQFLSV